MTAGSDTGNGLASSLTDMALAGAELRDDRPPGRVGQRREGAVHSVRYAILILNHMVKCKSRAADCQPGEPADRSRSRAAELL